MGKMKYGILDAFSGTIGRVVGAFWRGVAVMRSKAHSRKNANTPKQQEQKGKLTVEEDGLKRKKVLCRNSRPLTIACHMKKKIDLVVVKLLASGSFSSAFQLLCLFPATVVDDVKVQRVYRPT